MPSTQKNSGKTMNRSRSQTQKKSTTPKKSAVQKNKASSLVWERIVGGLLCLLMAMFMILSIFQIDAVVVNLLSSVLKGVIGYGFWLLVPVFLLASYLLLFQYREPITLRMWCTFLLPVLFGALIHVFLAGTAYTFSLEGVKQLWSDGQLLTSGGAVSGFIAVLFSQLFSNIGATLIFLLSLLSLILGAFHITPEHIRTAVRNAYQSYRQNREYVDDEPEDDYEEIPPPPPPRGKRRMALDLPLDDPPTPEPTTQNQRSFFKKDSEVKRPDEVLVDLQQEDQDSPPTSLGKKEVQPTSTVAQEESVSAPLPITLPLTPVPEPLVERELTKSEKRELIREHQESVARDVATVMEVHSEYEYPSITLLHEIITPSTGAVQEELSAIQKRLSDTIQSFGIVAKITGAVRGPSITRYEVELEQGVRLNKLTNLSDDIALALGASSVRIAPVPGKISLVGIEVPNNTISPVCIREVIASETFSSHKSKVSFAVGKDIGGNYIIGDAAKLPHLLIAGTTGSGKSVCTNSLIISMLYKATPEEVRLIMVDPKMVELGIYNGIPHLLIPVVTDPKKAAGALQWAVTEMMKRYRMFSEVGVRDLASYNAHTTKHEALQKLPQIVIVIDELADLMLVAAKEVEESICRVAQMGRAAGMHLIIATQRPSADVITGLMKANIPSRIAFAVASSLESRIILDTQGAEKLVGKGDMLWFPLGSGKPLRVQGCLINDEEVASIVEFVKRSGNASYDEAVLLEIEQHAEEQGKGSKTSVSDPFSDDANGDCDELFSDAVEIVLEMGQASVSMLQRRLKLGYSRAARLVDQMEDRGIVGPFEGSKPRQLLLSRDQWDEMQGRKRNLDEIFSDTKMVSDEDSTSSFFETSLDDSAPPWEDPEDTSH
ncbi:MAG: ftsK [Evtepia sp.]|nr:ftsK [Evtepia sp.]